jgi:transcriptional regulator NrdR family protein
MNKSVLIKKYSGEYQVFDLNKLINSLRRSVADEDIIQNIARKVQEQIEEGMTTKKI